MLSEDKEVMHPDNVVLVVCIPQPVQVLQHPDLHPGLVIEGCLILDDLNRYHFSCLLANALCHLPKSSLTQHVTDNIPAKQVELSLEHEGALLDKVVMTGPRR